MALAWKCDRCKKYFCGTSFCIKISPIIQVQLKESSEVQLTQNYSAGEITEYDLCPTCVKDVEKEIGGEKNEH